MEMNVEKLKLDVKRLKRAESTIREVRQDLEAELRRFVHGKATSADP